MDQKAVTQPVTAPTSAGERPRAQNRPNPPISSAHERSRAFGSYLISVRSVVRVYPGPLLGISAAGSHVRRGFAVTRKAIRPVLEEGRAACRVGIQLPSLVPDELDLRASYVAASDPPCVAQEHGIRPWCLRMANDADGLGRWRLGQGMEGPGVRDATGGRGLRLRVHSGSAGDTDVGHGSGSPRAASAYRRLVMTTVTEAPGQRLAKERADWVRPFVRLITRSGRSG